MTIYTQADIDLALKMLKMNVLQIMEGGRSVTYRSRSDLIDQLRMMTAAVYGTSDPNVPVSFSRGDT